MAVCECEYSWHVFPYTLPILLVPHNSQSPGWCLDTAGAAGGGMEAQKRTYRQADWEQRESHEGREEAGVVQRRTKKRESENAG